MRLIFLTHPARLGSQSMPRFARMIGEGMRARGHQVTYWTSPSFFSRIPMPGGICKWLGYVDQFVIFPSILRNRLKRYPKETLIVTTDQALGPWIPTFAHRPHVVHCHDFLAQRAALNEFPEKKVSWTGQYYQRFIRRGYRRATAFISVSNATRVDLHRFLDREPGLSEVIPNPLNDDFRQLPLVELAKVETSLRQPIPNKFILHVGGNQWYKNRDGVVRAYHRYAETNELPIPLVMVGPEPTSDLKRRAASVPSGARVIFMTNVKFEILRYLYHRASLLFFPSLYEGFGWPIAEAIACGCPVLTTDEAPMSEVGCESANYLPRMPFDCEARERWLDEAALTLRAILDRAPDDRTSRSSTTLKDFQRFDPDLAMDAYEEAYQRSLCLGTAK